MFEISVARYECISCEPGSYSTGGARIRPPRRFRNVLRRVLHGTVNYSSSKKKRSHRVIHMAFFSPSVRRVIGRRPICALSDRDRFARLRRAERIPPRLGLELGFPLERAGDELTRTALVTARSRSFFPFRPLAKAAGRKRFGRASTRRGRTGPRASENYRAPRLRAIVITIIVWTRNLLLPNGSGRRRIRVRFLLAFWKYAEHKCTLILPIVPGRRSPPARGGRERRAGADAGNERNNPVRRRINCRIRRAYFHIVCDSYGGGGLIITGWFVVVDANDYPWKIPG